MSAVFERLPSVTATGLRLLGGVDLSWQGRRNQPWAYAKLPAMLVVLGDAGHHGVRRDWLAALLWPSGDSASLRRALYDLRRQLRHGGDSPGPIEAERETLRLREVFPSDIDVLHSAWRTRDQPGDIDRAEHALALWHGEFAAGLQLPDCDEFDFWLQQARSRWQQRALELALALARRHLSAGRASRALEVARLAAEQVPDAEPARALVWRCLVANGSRLAAVEDWRGYQELMAAQGLQPSAALRRQAAELGLLPPAASGPAVDDERSLADALGLALRSGEGDVDDLLRRAQARLLGAGAEATSVLLLRRALMLQLMHAPWHDTMAQLAARAESLLCRPLPDADRVDLIQPLAMWHGWMGRGMHGESLLRGVGSIDDDNLPAATRVRHAMTLALCHSCSTGDPQRSIRAARRGLKIARAGAVPGCTGALAMLVANAALNRGQPGDAMVAQRALAKALSDGPLQRFDLVNHHQLSAQWQLHHGSPAQALADAEQGRRMAQAVPFPLQGLSCTLLAIASRMLMDESPLLLAGPLADATQLARRIGSQGYLMNALLLSAALARREGDALRAGGYRSEAQSIARACGVQRVRKIPRPLLDEALAAEE